MEILEFIFGQYREYSVEHIILEIIAIIASIVSVLYSRKNSSLVFPFGIIGSIIFIYLTIQWEFPGETMINSYYLIMSLYGWHVWTSKSKNGNVLNPISRTTLNEWIISIVIFLASAAMVYLIYQQFNMFKNWVNYLDILTTGTAFAGAWLMARRKLEHWLVFVLADIISIPLYFSRGYTFTSLLFVFYFIIAIFGYLEWKKYLNKQPLKA